MKIDHCSLLQVSLVALVGMVGCGSGAGAPESQASTSQASTTNPYVFLVLMENHSYDQVIGTRVAPYINSLVAQYASATNYTTTVHPSEPNYVWLEAGSNDTGDITFTTDNDPSASNSSSTTLHLATQLTAAGVTWKSYQEGLDANTGLCPITSVGAPEDYAAKHNPFVFFQDVSGNPPSATNAFCVAHHAPFTQLASDLSAGTVANYNFVTPNLCDDMHGASGCSSKLVERGDTWLSNNLPQMINWVTAHAGVVLVVWDEGGGKAANGPLPFLAIGPHVKPAFASTLAYSHSSTLKSIEEIFGVGLLRGAADPTTNDFADLFEPGFFP